MPISIALKKLSMAAAGASFITLGTVSAAPADAYTFTKIADNKGSFSSFSSFHFDSTYAPAASINNSGTVAFGANLDAGGSGIFTSNGITTTTIADTNTTFSELGRFSLNDAGTVAFEGRPSTQESISGIFTSNGITTTTIDTRDGFYGTSLKSPVINNAGLVAYIGWTPRSACFIVSSEPSSECDLGTFTYPGDLALNDAGTVVATIFSPGWPSLLIDNVYIYGDNNPFRFFEAFDINNLGTVAFATWVTKPENEDFGFHKIFTTKNATEFTTIAEDEEGFFAEFRSLAINDRGKIAFWASSWDVWGGGIFTGTNPLTDKVIAVGDTLFGSTVQGLGFFREGLNNSGQIAFFASLADGTVGIFRADPDPVPQSVPEHSGGLTLLAFGAVGAGAVLKRKQKRLFNSAP